MTASSIDGPDWLAAEREALSRVDLKADAQSVGRVEAIADGVAQVSGLPEARLGELLRFEGGRMGYTLSLEPEAINAAIFDEAEAIGVGSLVATTGEIARVPVGPALLGRVIDPLGRPLDRNEQIAAEAFHPIERPAPAIIDRDLVSEPVATGILVVDALFALGRGQRELIIGDRATGKTSIAVDTIINQKRSDMICIYVAVGQRATAVERVVEAARQFGAPERCVFVVASAAASAALQWIAPFAGFTIGEYFRDRGGHALVIVDDLTKHAATHRELALLTREPPGREAFPADIFYVHARLLERAAKLSPELGGGSLTALPIAETDAGNLSAFIPTNLISITDGQIVLDFAPLRRQSAPRCRCRPEREPSRRQSAGAGVARGLRAAETRLFAVSRTRDVHALRRHRRYARPRDDRPRRAHPGDARPAPLRHVEASRSGRALVGSVGWRVRWRAGRKSGRGPRARCGATRRVGAGDGRLGHGDRILRRGGTQKARRGGARARQRGEAAVTERLSDLVARIGSVRQLSSVIGAMRGIAAARAREARERVEGVRAYASTVGAAIGQALALAEDRGVPSGSREGRGGHLVIALCAEQGFAGLFNRRVLDVAERLLKADGSHERELVLLGGRGLAAAEERGLEVGWSAAMVAHVDEVGALADRVTEQLYARLESGRATRVSVVHAAPAMAEIRVVERALAPFDFERFPRAKNPSPPIISLAPQILLAELAQEYVFAELCEALTLSLAAENEARLRAMTAAKSNVTKMLEELIGRSRQLRQEEITSEIIELGARKARGS